MSSRWWLWAAALLLATLFAALARWQYGRGLDKERYLADWSAALAGSEAVYEAPAKVVRPQRVEGRFHPVEASRWLLLDNQRLGNEVGVHAYAVVRRLHDSRALLVDFGWLPMASDRRLPALPDLPADLDLHGLLLPWPGQAIALAANPWQAGTAPVLLTTLHREEVEAAFGLELVDGVLRLAAEQSTPFRRDATALPNTLPPEKHFGYALQWAGLAMTVLVVAGVLEWRKPKI